MLKYPTLCTGYYKAITFFVDTKGYKVRYSNHHETTAGAYNIIVFLLQLRLVPDELISNILKSIEIGLYQFGAEVQMICFEFLQAFGTFIHLEQNNTTFTYQTAMQFIGIVVEMVMLKFFLLFRTFFVENSPIVVLVTFSVCYTFHFYFSFFMKMWVGKMGGHNSIFIRLHFT